MATADLILFGIQSAIRLGTSARQAYVDSTAGRAFSLPLPEFEARPNASIAVRYFLDRPAVDRRPSVKALLQKVADRERNPSKPELTDDDEHELVECYLEATLLEGGDRQGKVGTDGVFFADDSLRAMVAIRQWQRGAEPNPTPLQRVAGTLLEIGVDYFAHVPGALNANSTQGKAVAALLTALDDIAFSTLPLEDLPVRLFTATIETLASHGEIVSGNPHVQALIKVAATGLAADVGNRIAEIRARPQGGDASLEDDVLDWSEVVFRSVLRNAGDAMATDPKTFLGVDNPAKLALIQQVTQALLGLVLDGSPAGPPLEVGEGALDAIAKAALKAVGDHPELVVRGGDAGLKALVTEIANQLSGVDRLTTPDVLTQTLRLILEESGRNLDLIWPPGSASPRNHLLLTVAQKVFAILAAPPASGQRWTPRFSTEDITSVIQFAFNEVIANPGWLVDRAGALNPNLAVALDAAVTALRDKGDVRLAPGTAVQVLKASLSAVALRQDFLTTVGDRTGLATALDSILDAIFDPALDPRAAWRLIRADTIEGAVRIGLDALGRSEMSDAALTTLRETLAAQVKLVAGGKPWDLASFAAALAVAVPPSAAG